MRTYITSFLLLFICSMHNVNAQLTEQPLTENQTIKGFRLKNPENSTRTSIAADTLSLPFIDDFAQEGIYPNSDLWTDSNVFVNSTFCDNPPTVGCATFDGIDKFGNRYTLSSPFQHCDTLTSKPLYLGAYASDTTLWLSFYYQPKGTGLSPSAQDSLLLYFKDNTGLWVRAWFRTGVSAGAAFQRVNVHINDTRYLYDGFQFRFMNYGPGNKNSDHWNIDYVYLNYNRRDNDSAFKDIAMINKPRSILSEFTAMPWPHYSASIPSVSTTRDSIRSINYDSTTVSLYKIIYDAAGNILFFDTAYCPSLVTGDDTTLSTLLNGFTFPPTTTDSATFIIKDSLNRHALVDSNDITVYHQNFFNYYAYDDGSAESTTGLSGTNRKFAAKFNIKEQDTLRGVQIYFNPTSTDVSFRPIHLAVWSNVDVGSNTANQIYLMIDQFPRNVDSINGFATYKYDAPLIVGPGNIWVGFTQSNESVYETYIGMGVDRNVNNQNNMFISYNNQWYTSSFVGSWMLRPVFGKDFSLVSTNEISNNNFEFEVFPNPSTDKLRFNIHNPSINYELTDIAGRIVLQGKLISPEVNVSGLSSGIYFVRVKDDKNQIKSGAKKIIISH
jgi:hypothetical protein